jgi:hypothetical protein
VNPDGVDGYATVGIEPQPAGWRLSSASSTLPARGRQSPPGGDPFVPMVEGRSERSRARRGTPSRRGPIPGVEVTVLGPAAVRLRVERPLQQGRSPAPTPSPRAARLRARHRLRGRRPAGGGDVARLPAHRHRPARHTTTRHPHLGPIGPYPIGRIVEFSGLAERRSTTGRTAAVHHLTLARPAATTIGPDPRQPYRPGSVLRAGGGWVGLNHRSAGRAEHAPRLRRRPMQVLSTTRSRRQRLDHRGGDDNATTKDLGARGPGGHTLITASRCSPRMITRPTRPDLLRDRQCAPEAGRPTTSMAGRPRSSRPCSTSTATTPPR